MRCPPTTLPAPDGTKLVHQARQGAVADLGNLYLHDLVTGERTRLTDLDLELPMWWPVTSDVSPDGERVVYSRPRTSKLQTTWDVWVRQVLVTARTLAASPQVVRLATTSS